MKSFAGPNFNGGLMVCVEPYIYPQKSRTPENKNTVPRSKNYFTRIDFSGFFEGFRKSDFRVFGFMKGRLYIPNFKVFKILKFYISFIL